MKYRKINPPEALPLDDSIIIEGDALHALKTLPERSVRCAITSPPYWGLRDYGIDGQIGLETTLPQFLNHLVAIFNELKRVLRDDGTLWLNIGDGYTRGNWDINTQGVAGAHFSTFPTQLIEPCVLASTKPGDYILDPFFGSGTVGVTCLEKHRRYVGIELNPEYVALALDRLSITKDRIMKVAV